MHTVRQDVIQHEIEVLRRGKKRLLGSETKNFCGGFLRDNQFENVIANIPVVITNGDIHKIFSNKKAPTDERKGFSNSNLFFSAAAKQIAKHIRHIA